MFATIDADKMKKDITHIPVMSTEIQEYLNLKSGDIFVDCTLGLGGHASQAAEAVGSQGRIIGIDRDMKALEIAGQRLAAFPAQCDFVHKDYRHIDQVLAD
ncbi:MAG: 16S rRNA (cytosine(1402)-N(4))-methyltransferase, partial [Candidatus Heimdallarchaeota archaeon]|nr:16S rRNA (cytosine(1402)-N(4))-methyltransferase [Candidatus Heimdallarchaeota archaeon]